jgi:MFS family permease
VLATLGTALIVLKGLALFRFRVNSDETQHLHVAWGWTVGLVPYRDVFDNHAPLFHMLSAPLVGFLGERPDIVILMRMAMVPLSIAALASAFFIARRLYSLRIALWTVVVVVAYPPFFLKSLEYRTDNLWTALWMVAMALIVVGRRVLAGFVLGCAVCTSMKTLPLVMALLVAGLVTHFLIDRERSLAALLRRVAAPAAAFLIMPSILAAFFYLQGAWRPMLYCVFEFNLLATRLLAHPVMRAVLCLACFLLMILFAARIGEHTQRLRFLVAFLVVTFFLTTQSFWPILSQRDYLAVMPLMAMFIVAYLISRGPRVVAMLAPAVLTILFAAFLFRYTNGFRDRAGEQIAAMREVLALTRPGDCVMDLKGETVYRPRPFYYALETIARTAISRQLIADTIPEAVISGRCHLAGADALFFPPRARTFLTNHFLDLGALRASGQWIRSDGSFSVAVPGRYVMAGRNGLVRGVLDGAPIGGAVSLDAGNHRFIRATAGERVACFWAVAFERGYSPFQRPGRSFR